MECLDATRGGRVSPSEWAKCGKKLFKKCTLQRLAGYIRHMFKGYSKTGTNGLDKAKFAKLFGVLTRYRNIKCRRFNKAMWAFKRCDASRGGLISRSEWRKCSGRVGLRACIVRRYRHYISRVLRYANKAKFAK